MFDSRTEHEVLEFKGAERWAITAFMYRATDASAWPKQPSPALPRILVAIASYRDEECKHTIDDLFGTASSPGRVRVAVMDQSDHATVRLPLFSCCFVLSSYCFCMFLYVFILFLC